MNFRKRFLGALAALAILLAGGLVATASSPSATAVSDAPAMTLVAYSDCPAGQGCLWTGTNGSGSRLNIAFGTYGYACYSFATVSTFYNSVSSGRAGYGSGLRLQVFTETGCFGAYQIIENGNNENMVSYTDNAVKSFKILPL